MDHAAVNSIDILWFTVQSAAIDVLVNNGAGYGLSPIQREAVTWSIADILPFNSPGINIIYVWIETLFFSFKKINSYMQRYHKVPVRRTSPHNRPCHHRPGFCWYNDRAYTGIHHCHTLKGYKLTVFSISSVQAIQGPCAIGSLRIKMAHTSSNIYIDFRRNASWSFGCIHS